MGGAVHQKSILFDFLGRQIISKFVHQTTPKLERKGATKIEDQKGPLSIMISKKTVWVSLLFGLAVASAFLAVFFATRPAPRAVTNFKECVAAGYPVLESYPRRCQTPDGKTFVEDIGNALEKTDLIQTTAPRTNQVVSSPLVVEGRARGRWYFEASFPVFLFDANGKELTVAPRKSRGNG